MLVTWT